MKVCPACRADYGGGEVFCPVDATRLVANSEICAPLDPDDPILGTVLAGRYAVERRIGEGGMGLVYQARHREIDKPVAIKVLRDDLSGRPDVLARFRQEARSASRIGHENIVDISDFGETSRGASYFVMEFLEGEDLAMLMGREMIVAPERACAIVLQCCRALSATHAKGIVHRDIKPENIFLTTREGRTDFVKIVDFGIAKMSDIETEGAPGRKLTKTGMIFGTPEYMSPEQAAGKDLDHRVDIYALGIILFECVAGRVPFEGDTFMGVLTQHLFLEVPPIHEVYPEAEVTPELEQVIRKALAKDPDDRYQGADELAEAIICALAGEVSEATAQTRASVLVPRTSFEADTLVPKRKTPKWVWAAVAATALGLLGWAGLGGEPERAVAKPVIAEEPVSAKERSEAVTEQKALPALELEPTFVNVHVATDPEGAKVMLADGTEACASTPCTLETEPGATLVLTAELGKKKGRTAITPTSDQTVLIDLQAPKRKRPSKPATAQASRPAQSSASRSGEFKVPSWAQ